MKAVLVLAVLAVTMAGCVSVGSGSAYGYVVAVGSEFGTPTAYVKASLDSAREDLYCATKTVKPALEEAAAGGYRVKVTYETSVCFGVNADCGDSSSEGIGRSRGCAVEGRITAVERV